MPPEIPKDNRGSFTAFRMTWFWGHGFDDMVLGAWFWGHGLDDLVLMTWFG
jgi:hypothetical protein